MESELWRRVKEIFQGALELDESRRAEFLERSCGDDERLRREVESLLCQDKKGEYFIDSPALEFVGKLVASDAVRESGTKLMGSSSTLGPMDLAGTAGTAIGRYQLLQKIGEGGMGEVWLAEQKEPVRRRVALKLVKAGMNTREVMVRFESERQALALMDHPAIAKVFDAGSTPQGAPYFVMEYVAGVPITAYCDNHRLSIRERLELFVHVCEGVQHAHQKAIIHRDLKPSNILVLEVDGRAAPKIIDFGVAKALTERLTADTMFTRVGALVGTPEYMSPEQADSSGEDIDTRTDVYSLGIIFYELLAGGPPIGLRRIAFEEFLRRLREDQPPKPSTKIRTQDPATSTDVARKRQSEPLALAKQMRGELDAIALKALEKDRSRRYASPSELAADIARYLSNEAVLAVSPSVAYRTRKFAHRYRVALVTISAFALVLIGAAAVSIRQSMRANREAVRANREAAVAEAVNDFLQNDLLAQASAATQSGPSAKPDPHLEVRTALDRAAQRIEGKFASQPDVEAAIRNTVGQTYTDLGLYPEATKQLERAVDLRRRVLGPEHPDTLMSMNNLALVYDHEFKYAQAKALDSQVLEIRRRVLGPEHRDTLKSMSDLGVVYDDEGKYAQAEVLFSQVLEVWRRVLGPEHPDTLNSISSLAVAYQKQGEYVLAETYAAQALAGRQHAWGPEHVNTLASEADLALAYVSQGKFAESEPLAREVVEVDQKKQPDNWQRFHAESLLGASLAGEKKYAEAEPLLVEGYQGMLARKDRIAIPDRYHLELAHHWLVQLYKDWGKPQKAAEMAKQSD